MQFYQCNGLGWKWVSLYIINLLLFIVTFFYNLYFRDESFLPENTFSPDLQLMYDCVAQSAVNKSLTTTIPENIQNLLCPPKRIKEKTEQPINELKKLFSFASKTDEK